MLQIFNEQRFHTKFVKGFIWHILRCVKYVFTKINHLNSCSLPLAFCKKGVLRNFGKFTASVPKFLFENGAGVSLQLYSKRNSGAGEFQWLLRNFRSKRYYREEASSQKHRIQFKNVQKKTKTFLKYTEVRFFWKSSPKIFFIKSVLIS